MTTSARAVFWTFVGNVGLRLVEAADRAAFLDRESVAAKIHMGMVARSEFKREDFDDG